MRSHARPNNGKVDVIKVFWNIMVLFLIHTDCLRSSASAYHWKLTSDQACTNAQLASPWTAPSVISCIAQCKIRFSERCLNVVYNLFTGSCTPVHPTSRGDVSPSAQPGDVVYSEDNGLGVVCDTGAGFQLYQGCGAAVCVLLVSEAATHFTAEAYCQERNATLFIPQTFEKFAMMGLLNPQNSWIAMKKLDGVWRWTNGDLVETDLQSYMWDAGQPDEHFHDFCALVTPGHFKLHDAPCHYQFSYACEQQLA